MAKKNATLKIIVWIALIALLGSTLLPLFL